MINLRTRSAELALPLVLGSLCLWLTACSDARPTTEQPLSAENAHSYTVRGIITELPDPSAQRPALMIHHEAIEKFVGAGGEVVGMESMTMPFYLTEDVSLKGLEVGDKIRFTFAVNWETNDMGITSIEQLPPETTLDFQEADHGS